MKSHCVAFAFAAGTAACSGPSNSSIPDPLPITVTTDSGSLRVELHGSSPTVGTNQMELTVTNAHGVPQDGLSIAVSPYMPSMGHGTASPSIVAEGKGTYAVNDLYLFMPGTWELKIHVSGPVSDDARITFQLQ